MYPRSSVVKMSARRCNCIATERAQAGSGQAFFSDRTHGWYRLFIWSAGEELARLRRKVRQLETERDILSHAAAWSARQTGAIPPRGTDS